MPAAATEERRIISADTGNEEPVFGTIAVRVVQTDRYADFAKVGRQFKEGGLIAGACWMEIAGEQGVFGFVVAVVFGDPVVAHIY